MQVVRFIHPDAAAPRVGVLDGGLVTAFPEGATLGSLLQGTGEEFRARCSDPSGEELRTDDVRLLAPVDGRTEVWAAGVTYENSRLARMEESEHEADIYARVYDAERPELFFKSTSWKVRASGEPVGVRADSPINVPEPEAALVVAANGDIVGLTICNDMSSRSLEAENPLYLPQAKIYAGACALGPGIRPLWEVEEPHNLALTLTIRRSGGVVWTGNASTGQLKRGFGELVECLFTADAFPEGVVLATGTCLVPALPFTLESGDVVEVSLQDVGTLVNHVHAGIDDAVAVGSGWREADTVALSHS